jgi:hypothetical protein
VDVYVASSARCYAFMKYSVYSDSGGLTFYKENGTDRTVHESEFRESYTEATLKLSTSLTVQKSLKVAKFRNRIGSNIMWLCLQDLYCAAELNARKGI